MARGNSRHTIGSLAKRAKRKFVSAALGGSGHLEADMRAVRHLFDADWYRNTYADMNGTDKELLRHYMVFGWKESRNPSASFTTSVYLEDNDDVRESGTNPFLHFALYGQAEGRRSTADGSAPRRAPKKGEYTLVRKSFDAAWYGKTYSDVTGSDEDMLQHFMHYGWREGRDPAPWFSTKYYLENYPDIARGGSNPFVHYILFGHKEGRRPSAASVVGLLKVKGVNLTPSLPVMMAPPAGTKFAKPPKTVDRSALDIHWIIPDFQVGSGGHMTIFRMVRFLESFGHKMTIWIEAPKFHATPAAAWENIVKHFQCVEADVRFVTDEIYQASGDVIIATGWSTAWQTNYLKGFAAKMYFVQDHEPEFYPTGAMSNLAKATYGFDFGCICASPWLEQLMTEHYGRWAKSFDLAYEPEQYQMPSPQAVTPVDATDDQPTRIAVYGRLHTDRRCVQLALAALQALSNERDDFEVHFFGQDKLPFNEAPFTAYSHGILSPVELGDLYNKCDIGICFSGTNYSLVPQEMMACGLPLVELDTDSTRAIFPKNVVTLAGPAPADIAKKIGQLMDAPDKRARQSKAALKWVQSFSWEKSAAQVEAAILGYLTAQKVKAAAPAVSAARKDILLDVVVPTWNGKEEFSPVLDALRSQDIADQVQIHCVDSSSTDGTIDWLKKQKDISLTVIDQADFQHGRTRNFGASLGSAPLISFITQDAMPAGKGWASDIVKMMRAVPEAAGLFGRHIAYPDHPSFVRDEIKNHFDNFLNYPLVVSKFTDRKKWDSGDQGWRQFLHFYSDNNSAMRRDIWNEIPYPEVDYGEDQVWARDIIEAGYSKIYAPTAAVFHSHDFDPEGTYKRSKTEGAFFYEHFGYELGNGSEEQIAQQVYNEQRNLETWGHNAGIDQAEIETRKANIAAKYRGWRDGRSSVLKQTDSSD